MSQQMIVTNVRMPLDEYQEVKSIAGEQGMSVNQYIRDSLQAIASYRQFGIDPKRAKKIKQKKFSIWDLPKLAKLADPDAPRKYELSEDDKIIYGEK